MALKRTKKTAPKKAAPAPKVEAIDEAIHDSIQHGKIEAAMAKSTPKPKAAPKTKAAARTLTKCMSGADVKKMQNVLGVEEDDFGFATLVALKKWQNVNGLTADGVAGPVTQSKLFG